MAVLGLPVILQGLAGAVGTEELLVDDTAGIDLAVSVGHAEGIGLLHVLIVVSAFGVGLDHSVYHGASQFAAGRIAPALIGAFAGFTDKIFAVVEHLPKQGFAVLGIGPFKLVADGRLGIGEKLYNLTLDRESHAREGGDDAGPVAVGLAPGVAVVIAADKLDIDHVGPARKAAAVKFRMLDVAQIIVSRLLV